MKNQSVHRLRAGIKSPNRNSNFFNPKWVKLGTLLKIPETKLKTKSLVTARGYKKKSKIKTTGLPPVKRFLYSHVARHDSFNDAHIGIRIEM